MPRVIENGWLSATLGKGMAAALQGGITTTIDVMGGGSWFNAMEAGIWGKNSLFIQQVAIVAAIGGSGDNCHHVKCVLWNEFRTKWNGDKGGAPGCHHLPLC